MGFLLIRLGSQIAKAVDDETVTRDLVPAFVKLLKDSEAEVRTAIAGQIPGRRSLSLKVSFVNGFRFLRTDRPGNPPQRDND